MWYTSCGFRVMLDILHCTEVGAFEFCSTLYMVNKCVLSSSAAHSTLHTSCRCRFLLDILHCTELGSVELCSSYYMVKSGRFRILLDNLKGKEVNAFEFLSTFYMLQKWELSTPARQFTRYSSGNCRVLIYILHGT